MQMDIGEEMSMFYGIIYILLINIVAFTLYGLDKKKAKKGLWRISEAKLLLIAIIGGSVGAIVGMRMFHHKTKHPKFYIGLPVILLFQLAVSVLIYRYFLL